MRGGVDRKGGKAQIGDAPGSSSVGGGVYVTKKRSSAHIQRDTDGQMHLKFDSVS